MVRIFGDPGHGGTDTANRGPTGYVEAHGVLDIALRLKGLLTPTYDVRLSRETDITLSLQERTDRANAWRADLLVSIHTNAASNPEAGGIETYYSRNGEWGDVFSDQARKVAQAVQEELVKATGLRDRGIKTRLVDRKDSPIYGMDYYAVIRRAKCPAILVEAGFHTNPHEEQLLKTSEFRQKIAEGIAGGIKKVYPVKTPEPTVKEINVQVGVDTLKGYLVNEVAYAPIRDLVDVFNARQEMRVAWDDRIKTAIVRWGR